VIYTFGKRSPACVDCWDGYCTMNCGPKVERKMAISDVPFYQKPNTDDLLPQIMREAREDRDEIRRLTRVVEAVNSAMAKGYGVPGGVLCIPPCPEQAELVDALAAYRLAKEGS